MRYLFMFALFGMAIAGPMFKRNEKTQLMPKTIDADDLVHNSWSARSELGHLPRDAAPDADDLVHNSWSARA
ncbi:hypothetical protein GGS24DRAFT_507697 [Hypoxylon argillaceum]|nr:hypothetical protein GGS24DRAFT_507697 [Hypoxylon argillaceum]KAI1151047.1 hypothetical protein F4825DRAFT_451894 [Nemania diffusa]